MALVSMHVRYRVKLVHRGVPAPTCELSTFLALNSWAMKCFTATSVGGGRTEVTGPVVRKANGGDHGQECRRDAAIRQRQYGRGDEVVRHHVEWAAGHRGRVRQLFQGCHGEP